MNELTLFAFPGACSRVSLILLEQAQADYQVHWVRLTKGEHKRPEFLAINPKAKVPALKIGNDILTENPAIISYINQRFPSAQLLPVSDNALTQLQQLSDLCFCSSTLHPMVTRFCKPEFFATSDAIISVKQKAQDALNDALVWVEQRMGQAAWWYGEQWSAMDAYLFWVLTRLQSADFLLAEWPNLHRFVQAMLTRPAVLRALAKEQQLA
jgi:glutathione S-transferase